MFSVHVFSVHVFSVHDFDPSQIEQINIADYFRETYSNPPLPFFSVPYVHFDALGRL